MDGVRNSFGISHSSCSMSWILWNKMRQTALISKTCLTLIYDFLQSSHFSYHFNAIDFVIYSNCIMNLNRHLNYLKKYDQLQRQSLHNLSKESACISLMKSLCNLIYIFSFKTIKSCFLITTFTHIFVKIAKISFY